MALRQRAVARLLSSAIAMRGGVATAAQATAAEAAPELTTAASDGRIYAACVLERLPILKSPAPSWELEHQAWRQERKLASGHLKRYPQLGDARQRELGDSASASSPGAGAAGAASASSSSSSAPFQTPADGSGDARTMKRRLRDKLVLLVKSEEGGGGGGGGWHFPAAERRDGETIRVTAERALRQAIGLPGALFFIGNAPMGHLEEEQEKASADGGGGSSSSSGSSGGSEARRAGPGGEGGAGKRKKTFFHLAQVLNDPWDVELGRKGGAVDYAWVAEDELDKYLGGGGGGVAAAATGGGSGGGSSTPLLDLTQQML